ncbi:hypothetical protein BC829DRAFT_236858 [Chytridium lagenaria]|nr:hypothetical protein BC829DRAFT_236858 [Chytridium lagenaria]
MEDFNDLLATKYRLPIISKDAVKENTNMLHMFESDDEIPLKKRGSRRAEKTKSDEGTPLRATREDQGYDMGDDFPEFRPAWRNAFSTGAKPKTRSGRASPILIEEFSDDNFESSTPFMKGRKAASTSKKTSKARDFRSHFGNDDDDDDDDIRHISTIKKPNPTSTIKPAPVPPHHGQPRQLRHLPSSRKRTRSNDTTTANSGDCGGDDSDELSPLEDFVNLNELKEKGQLGRFEGFYRQLEIPVVKEGTKRKKTPTFGGFKGGKGGFLIRKKSSESWSSLLIWRVGRPLRVTRGA